MANIEIKYNWKFKMCWLFLPWSITFLSTTILYLQKNKKKKLFAENWFAVARDKYELYRPWLYRIDNFEKTRQNLSCNLQSVNLKNRHLFAC